MKQNIPTRMIVHHANGTLHSSCTPTQHHDHLIVDDHHRTRWPGFTSREFKRPDNGQFYHCGYQFVIYLKDKEYGKWAWVQTRAVWEEGAHCIGKNTSSIGVLVVGNYDECSGEEMPEDIKKVFREVYKEANRQLKVHFNRTIPIEKIELHRRYASKSCPGNTVKNDFFQRVVMLETPVVELEEQRKIQEQITFIQKLLAQLQLLMIQFLNRSTSKRLSLREIKRA